MAFYNSHLGRRREVLFEAHKDKSLMSGFTDNYIKVEAPLDPDYINQIKTVQLMNINAAGNVDIVAMDIPDSVFDYV